jgi:hypothetical protein
MEQETLLLLILSGAAFLAVFYGSLVLFLRWAKRDRAGK